MDDFADQFVNKRRRKPATRVFLKKLGSKAGDSKTTGQDIEMHSDLKSLMTCRREIR